MGQMNGTMQIDLRLSQRLSGHRRPPTARHLPDLMRVCSAVACVTFFLTTSNACCILTLIVDCPCPAPKAPPLEFDEITSTSHEDLKNTVRPNAPRLPRKTTWQPRTQHRPIPQHESQPRESRKLAVESPSLTLRAHTGVKEQREAKRRWAGQPMRKPQLIESVVLFEMVDTQLAAATPSVVGRIGTSQIFTFSGSSATKGEIEFQGAKFAMEYRFSEDGSSRLIKAFGAGNAFGTGVNILLLGHTEGDQWKFGLSMQVKDNSALSDWPLFKDMTGIDSVPQLQASAIICFGNTEGSNLLDAFAIELDLEGQERSATESIGGVLVQNAVPGVILPPTEVEAAFKGALTPLKQLHLADSFVYSDIDSDINSVNPVDSGMNPERVTIEIAVSTVSTEMQLEMSKAKHINS